MFTSPCLTSPNHIQPRMAQMSNSTEIMTQVTSFPHIFSLPTELTQHITEMLDPLSQYLYSQVCRRACFEHQYRTQVLAFTHLNHLRSFLDPAYYTGIVPNALTTVTGLRLDFHKSQTYRTETMSKQLPNLQFILCDPPKGHPHEPYQSEVGGLDTLAFMTGIGERILQNPDSLKDRNIKILDTCCSLTLTLRHPSKSLRLDYVYHLDVQRFKEQVSACKRIPFHQVSDKVLRKSSVWSGIVTYCSSKPGRTLVLDRATDDNLRLWQDMAQDQESERESRRIRVEQNSLEVMLGSPADCY